MWKEEKNIRLNVVIMIVKYQSNNNLLVLLLIETIYLPDIFYRKYLNPINKLVFIILIFIFQ